jgi:hypothetical protein
MFNQERFLFNHECFKLWTLQRGKGGEERHMMQRVHGRESVQAENNGLPGFLPLLQRWVADLQPV